MVSAMQHCHARSVFHRDLKPENILLGGASLDEIKIADFGLAALLSQVDHGDGGHFLNHTKCGSIMYAAPELLLSNERVGYDPATADIWSLGLIVLELALGRYPYESATNYFQLLSKITEGPAPLAPERFSAEFAEVVSLCLDKDGLRRPKANDLLKHHFFQRHRKCVDRDRVGLGVASAGDSVSP